MNVIQYRPVKIRIMNKSKFELKDLLFLAIIMIPFIIMLLFAQKG